MFLTKSLRAKTVLSALIPAALVLAVPATVAVVAGLLLVF